ncbi:hypothetical protein [Agromyces bracchium]|uniref:Uncharacterized protein n=1 Tax=Agromyces bracchium TaxID=88376 RepID=A0A6I3M8E1_9MICO|nr:hypothetical protein [Agromyces bracchium]MTH66823.1 hypothetical protein [Agromyces bracchium]
MPTDDAPQPTSPHRCPLPAATAHAAGTIWECDHCGSRYRRVIRTGMQLNAMWDHDPMYRLRRAVILGAIGVPILLVLIGLLVAMTRT